MLNILVAIKPLNEADVEKMMVVLNRMREEDPTWVNRTV